MPEGTRQTTEGVLIRFDPKHLKLVKEAAGYVGLPHSAWMRATVIREARQILAERSDKGEEGQRRKTA